MNIENAKRAGLHLLFAVVIGGLVAVPQVLGYFHVPAYVNVFIASVAGSAVSFFRTQDAQVDSPTA